MVFAEMVITKKGQVPRLDMVKHPAVEVEGILKMQKVEASTELQMHVDTEKRVLTAPALIPDKWYERNAEFFQGLFGINEPGFFKCSKETVREIGMDLLRPGNEIGLDHKKLTQEGDVELLESWFIETTNDKAYDLGFNPKTCTIGTLMRSQYINSDAILEKVKNGDYTGFSIQGKPSFRLLANASPSESGVQMSEDQILEILSETIKNYKE